MPEVALLGRAGLSPNAEALLAAVAAYRQSGGAQQQGQLGQRPNGASHVPPGAGQQAAGAKGGGFVIPRLHSLGSGQPKQQQQQMADVGFVIPRLHSEGPQPKQQQQRPAAAAPGRQTPALQQQQQQRQQQKQQRRQQGRMFFD